MQPLCVSCKKKPSSTRIIVIARMKPELKTDALWCEDCAKEEASLRSALMPEGMKCIAVTG